MANSIFDQLRDAAKRTAQDLDEKFDLKNKFEQGVNTAGEVARKATDSLNQTANQACATRRSGRRKTWTRSST